jgi:hypothetical protein
MKNKKKLILKKILQANLFPVLLYMVSQIFRVVSKGFQSIPPLMINSKTDKSCFLIATGPSVKSIDLSELIGKNVFTVSNFILHEALDKLNPIAHFIAAYHPPISIESMCKWFELMDNKLPSSTVIVTDLLNKRIISGKYFMGRKIIYLRTLPQRNLLVIDPPFMSPRPWSVPQLAIPYIFESGYDEIILCGCDHNTLINYGSTIEHFYDRKSDVRKGASDKIAWTDGGILKQLENNLELFRLYRDLQEKYLLKGKKLYRYSEQGWLDFIAVKKNK